MKQINSLLIFLLFGLCVFAQAPNKMSYQAVIRKSADDLVVNRQVGMRLSILQGSANGVVVYAETHRPTTNENGLVSLEIGGGTVLSGNFSSIPWSAGPYFIKTETDVKGGRNYTISGTSQLLSVPYALYAEKAGTTTAGTIKNQMMYWTGNSWSTLNPGENGQVLTLCKGELIWTADGKCPGAVDSLNCADLSIAGTLKRNIYNDSVFVNIPYTGGDKGYYPAMNIASTGVTGFNAVLKAGQLNEGNGNLLFKISGASSETGNAVFEIKLGNKSCTVSVPVKQLLSSPQVQAVGSLFQGGVVAYIFQPGDPDYDPKSTKYLIAAPSDAFEVATLNAQFQWGCNGTAIPGADGTALLTGSQNTIDLEAACTTTGTAADYCANLVLNGYDDWFLPSREELIKIWANRDIIGGFLNYSYNYWTSTETTNPSYAWSVDFLTGLPFSNGKANRYLVRPVRFYATPIPPAPKDSSTCGIPGIHNVNKSYGTVTDHEGNSYKTIVIGTQEWMAENLKTKSLRNGDYIGGVNLENPAFWNNYATLKIPAWVYYNNDVINECPNGLLYNWSAVGAPEGLCPTGWHVPSKDEWSTLIEFLGGRQNAMAALKSTNSSWPDDTKTNSSGFSALPSGQRSYLGIYDWINLEADYWSSTSVDLNTEWAWYVGLRSGANQWVLNSARLKGSGHSVRCVKD